MDNGAQLKKIIADADMTQKEALDMFNVGQVRPLSLSQWKSYMSHPTSKRRFPCPDDVLSHMKKLLKVS
jgi:hypothetical protein